MTRVFVDTETIRLAPGVGVVWEIALITEDEQYHWQIKPDLTRADPKALEINRYHERIHPSIADHPEDTAAVLEHPDYVLFDGEAGSSTLARVAEEIAALTHGADLWGSNPAFDMAHLEVLLHGNGAAPTWHYHPNDLASMCAGWCAAKGITPVSARGDGRIRSDDWSRAIGVDPARYDRHSALGDARWCQAQWEHMTGAAVETPATLTDQSELSDGHCSYPIGPPIFSHQTICWLPVIAGRCADGHIAGPLTISTADQH